MMHKYLDGILQSYRGDITAIRHHHYSQKSSKHAARTPHSTADLIRISCRCPCPLDSVLEGTQRPTTSSVAVLAAVRAHV